MVVYIYATLRSVGYDKVPFVPILGRPDEVSGYIQGRQYETRAARLHHGWVYIRHYLNIRTGSLHKTQGC